ncbi:MAG TPA: cytochrome c biogenesis protein CcdA [Patescibacteria group bacterium]|nr:cytochrome c biogenesis protein CcdA [Patescibacteria group bacterium]
MSPTLLGASVVASFLGGILALLAPCCVTFIFPAYFASAFKEKSRILLMTFIFFLGLASVLVPVALGLSALSQLIARYHYEVFLGGGLFLIFLAILAIFGKTIPMPFYRTSPNLKKSDPLSIFFLGVISGAASSCCTPVLIGVLTVSALSGTFIYAFILSLTYVLGMVSPLIIMSYFWDKYDFSKSKLLQGRIYSWKLLGKEFYTHSTSLISTILFGGMGLLIVILTLTGKTATASSYQLKMSTFFNNLTNILVPKAKIIPEYIWLILAVLVLIFFVWQAIKFARRGDDKRK